MTTNDKTSRCSTCGSQIRTLGNFTDEEFQKLKLPDSIKSAMRAQSERRLQHMSPPGKLALAELLDQRRLEYGIPDEAFRYEAYGDRVLAWQIHQPGYEKGTYGETGIEMPDTISAGKLKAAPRGIIISAGLSARDVLHSHGIELGHIVLFCRNAPFRAPIGFVGATDEQVIVFQVGDIVASEDVRARILGGELSVRLDGDTHLIHDVLPKDPQTPGDY